MEMWVVVWESESIPVLVSENMREGPNEEG